MLFVDDHGEAHICMAVAQLGDDGNGVQPRVLGQREGHHLQRVREGAHAVALHALPRCVGLGNTSTEEAAKQELHARVSPTIPRPGAHHLHEEVPNPACPHTHPKLEIKLMRISRH